MATAHFSARWQKWLLPSVSHWLWLLLFAILLTPPWPTRMVARDGDPCRHWAVGEQMLQTRDIMRVDTFSHTRAETPIIAKPERFSNVSGELLLLAFVC